MKHTIGLIKLQESNHLIPNITRHRPLATIPFAGRYRLIDFILSNMVNSGIEDVGILLPEQPASVLDHIRSGKDWDLVRRHSGLFYLPFPNTETAKRNELEAFYHYLAFLERSTKDYVLLANGHTVFNMDFNPVLRFHQNTDADITMLYCNAPKDMKASYTILKTAADGLVNDIAICPSAKVGEKTGMGIYLISRHIFIDIVRYAYEHGGFSLLLDGIMQLQDKYRILGYPYNGYVSIINSTQSYYQTSMDLLNANNWRDVFNGEHPIYTRTKDDLPTHYNQAAKTHNCLISSGCQIEGEVENSILFRNVLVRKGAKIKNSIIMQKCTIDADTILENVICDKNVLVKSGNRLKGAPNYPFIVEKDTVI